MATLKLSQNQETIIDDKYYNILSQFNWYAKYNRTKTQFYAIRNKSINDNWPAGDIKIHRYIMYLAGHNITNKQIDHINGNTLDNRIENLRLCTSKDNNRNASKRQDNTSGYKGVSWHKGHQKWAAYIRVNKKLIHLGYFFDKIDAANTYNKFATQYFKEFAKLNDTTQL